MLTRIGTVPRTRRYMLAGLAGGALGAPLPQMLRLPRPIRLGLVGFEGHTGEVLDPLPRLPDVRLVCAASGDPEALRKFEQGKRGAGVKLYSDYRRMMDAERLDLVAVCNNNGERAAAILEAASRQLDIIAEKPLAIGRRDFERVQRAVSENRVRLGMLLPMRFDPEYQAIKQVVESGEIGEVLQIASQKSYKLGDRPAWFRTRSTYGSTILWIGIHMIDLMRWTSGREFVEAAGYQARLGFPEAGDMETVTASLFRLDNGGIAVLRMDYMRPQTAGSHGDDRLRLAGTKGVIEYMAATGVTVLSASGKPRELHTLPPASSVFLDFLNAAYNGANPALPLADIFRVNEITLAAHEAAELGRTVRIPAA